MRLSAGLQLSIRNTPPLSTGANARCRRDRGNRGMAWSCSGSTDAAGCWVSWQRRYKYSAGRACLHLAEHFPGPTGSSPSWYESFNDHTLMKLAPTLITFANAEGGVVVVGLSTSSRCRWVSPVAHGPPSVNKPTPLPAPTVRSGVQHWATQCHVPAPHRSVPGL